MSTISPDGPLVDTLSPERADELAGVMAEAFADYPVMRFVIGEAGAEYGERLRRLVRFFVEARIRTGGVLLGVSAPGGGLVAGASLAPPDPPPAPPALAESREVLWEALGVEARARYERYGAVTARFEVSEAHYHLSMIGVRPGWAGRGLAKRLLEALHERSRRDPASRGVTLNTESARNVELYRHFGYRVLGDAPVGPGLHTWALFRPDAREPL